MTCLENVLKRTCHIQDMSCSLLRQVSCVETCLVFWRHVPKSTRHVSETTCHSILCPKMTCLKCQMFVFWRHVRGKDKTCLVFRHVFLRHVVTCLGNDMSLWEMSPKTGHVRDMSSKKRDMSPKSVQNVFKLAHLYLPEAMNALRLPDS